MLFLLTLLACGDKDGEDPPTGEVGAEVTVSVAEDMPTVATVVVSLDTANEVTLRYGDLQRTLSSGSAKEHTFQLVALPQSSDVEVEVEVGGEVIQTATVTTGALAGAPTLTVEGELGDFMVLPIVDGDSAISIVDPKGRIVWWHEEPRDLSVFRGRIARDGSGVVYSVTVRQGEPDEDSAIVKVSWDGSEVEDIPIPFLAHDFVLEDDGSVISLGYEYQGDVQGNTLLRVNSSGAVSTIWNSWDCLDPEEHPSNDPEHGWTHANALDYSADEGVFLVGLRNQNSIVAVDEQSRTCPWIFGGAASTVTLNGGRFINQHQFERRGDQMFVFDNNGASGLESRVVEYDFPVGSNSATLVDDIRADPPLFSLILGDIHRYDNGDSMIVWSQKATIDRLDSGAMRTARVTGKGVFGFAELWTDPAIVADGPLN